MVKGTNCFVPLTIFYTTQSAKYAPNCIIEPKGPLVETFVSPIYTQYFVILPPKSFN